MRTFSSRWTSWRLRLSVRGGKLEATLGGIRRLGRLWMIRDAMGSRVLITWVLKTANLIHIKGL